MSKRKRVITQMTDQRIAEFTIDKERIMTLQFHVTYLIPNSIYIFDLFF